jgi:hypothetical protein
MYVFDHVDGHRFDREKKSHFYLTDKPMIVKNGTPWCFQ